MAKKRLCIYILEEVWKEFLVISKREGTNASQKLEGFMLTYNQQHSAGNPQLLMPSFLGKGSPSPNHVLCRHFRGRRNDGQVFCVNPSVVPSHEQVIEGGIQGRWVEGVMCYACRFNKLRRQEEVKKR